MLIANIDLQGGLTATASYSTVGEEVYTTPGTYSWTCPSGVTSVCVVCIGGGAGGGGGPLAGGSYGGGGGSLAYKNNISVTPGQIYTVEVGAKGISGGAYYNYGAKTWHYQYPTDGGNSFFINESTVFASGGQLGSGGNTIVGEGGGAGGNGGIQIYNATGGGGGAGGYGSSGGDGGSRTANNWINPTLGSNGSGNGGNTQIYFYGKNPMLGDGGQGASLYGPTVPGEPGQVPTTMFGAGSGGNYGGGGGGGSGSQFSSFGMLAFGDNGAVGAVRIIWGPGRAFPNTNVV